MYVANQNDRYWALAAHLSILLFPFVAPIVILLLRSDSRFVRHHAKQALLFHAIWIAMMTVSGWLVFLLIGIPLVIVFGLMGIWVTIRACFASLNEERYYYPITGHWF